MVASPFVKYDPRINPARDVQERTGPNPVDEPDSVFDNGLFNNTSDAKMPATMADAKNQRPATGKCSPIGWPVAVSQY
jgi:hypothetical protein